MSGTAKGTVRGEKSDLDVCGSISVIPSPSWRREHPNLKVNRALVINKKKIEDEANVLKD